MSNKLFDRIKFALKVALHDLFGEEDLPSGGMSGSNAPQIVPAEVPAFLNEAQASLDRLRVEAAGAAAYRSQCEREHQEAAAQADALDQIVDEALRAGQEEQAREALQKSRRTRQRAQEADARAQESFQVVARLEDAIREWQEQLYITRQKYADLVYRQQQAEALEEAHAFQQRLRKEITSLQSTLEQQKEAIARRQDYLAARDELRRSQP